MRIRSRRSLPELLDIQTAQRFMVVLIKQGKPFINYNGSSELRGLFGLINA
jgi:hypothetical protein